MVLAGGKLGGMIRRFELTDKQFALIEDLLPARGKRGGRWNAWSTRCPRRAPVAVL